MNYFKFLSFGFSGAPDHGPGIVEQVIMAVYSIFQLIVNSSYLATNIIMMASKKRKKKKNQKVETKKKIF